MNYQYTVTVANGGLSGGINGGGFLDVEMRYAAMLLDDDPRLPAENGSEWNLKPSPSLTNRTTR